MAGSQRVRIKGIYGEIKGLLAALPNTGHTAVPGSTGQQFNVAVNELSQVADTDYSRYELSEQDKWEFGNGNMYDPIATRARVSSLVSRLEEEYGFGAASTSSNSSPIILTVNQNQQLTVTVTPIQQVIDTTDDSNIRDELVELKSILETNNDPKQASNILNSIQQKSWEIFMKVLPFVLEQLGRRHGA